MSEWMPVVALPNVEIHVPIGCDFVALAPGSDKRVEDVSKKHPNFREFLGRFTDPFGQAFVPTILMVRADAPQNFFNVDTLASFRDFIAVSVISHNRARELR